MKVNKPYQAPVYRYEGDRWSFVIHCNFELCRYYRELCAYTTGRVGFDGVGEEHEDSFVEECPCDVEMDMIDVRLNTYQISSLVGPTRSLGSPNPTNTPGFNGVEIYFKEKPADKEVAFMKQRAQQFIDLHGNRKMKILGFFVLKESTTRETEAV
jgi:hypothetical protein